MTIEQLIKLVDAGFTAGQILQLTEKTESPTQIPTSAPVVEISTPEPVKAETDVTDSTLSTILKKIGELQTSIQAANIHRTEQEIPKPQTAEDILASIIAPRTN